MTKNNCRITTVFLMATSFIFCCTTAFGQAAQSTRSHPAQYDLIKLYQEAQINDSILQTAKEIQLAERQKLPLARAHFLPVVDIEVNYLADRDRERSRNLGAFHLNRYWLSVVQPIIHFEHWKKYSQATAIVKRANALYSAAEQNLMLRLATAYFNVLQAIDNFYFSKASVDAYCKIQEQTEERYKAGLTSKTDFEIAKAQHDNAMASLLLAENEICNQKERLRAIVGHEVDEILPLRENINFTPPEPCDLDKWIATSLAQNFDLQAGRFGTKAAKDNIKIHEYEHLPRVDATGNLSSPRNQKSITGPHSRSLDRNVGVRICVPVFQGGTVNYRTRQAVHEYLKTDRELETLYREVENLTRRSFRGVMTQIGQIGVLEQAMRSNENALQATTHSFNEGTRTIVDVLNAQRDLIRSQQAHSAARYQYVLSSLELKLAAGILCVEDLCHVNSWLQSNPG